MKDPIIIRPEMPEVISAIYRVNAMAFEQESEAKLVDALRLNKEVLIPGLSLVACIKGQIVGHILFSKVWIVDDTGNPSVSLSLAPMAILPGFQKMGIGGQLIQTGLDTAKKMGYQSVVVLGHPDYYSKFGFEPSIKWHIQSAYDVSPEVFMAMELVPVGLKNITGKVVYPPEFDTL